MNTGFFGKFSFESQKLFIQSTKKFDHAIARVSSVLARHRDLNKVSD